MSLTVRPYEHRVDYDRVAAMLVELYRPGELWNWLRPRWEYMHFHPEIAHVPFGKIGVAEVGDELVGVVHPESRPAFVYFQVRPGPPDMPAALLDYAEAHAGGYSETFERDVLGLYIDEGEESLEDLARQRGYVELDAWFEDHSLLDLSEPVPAAPLPEGFRLQTLAVENDLAKVSRVLWRGFDHPGPPPPDDIAGCRLVQSAPNHRRDLTVVAVEPGGAYVSYGGMWVVPDNRVAYVEPVATDPDYRRLGLGRAVVTETLRLARGEGAELAWVGSGLEFYAALGFELTCRTKLWLKHRPGD